jgi:hypothetical protein
MALDVGSTRTKIEHADNGLNLGDHFASSVAIDGDVAVIGVPDDDVEPQDDVGHVEIFTRDERGQWNSDPVVIYSPASQYGGRFGAAVAIQGGTILVGEPDTGNGGRVHVYGPDLEGEWELKATLDTNETSFGDGFGSALALNGDTAVIGARRTTGGGAVYVYQRLNDSWTRQQKIISTDLDSNDSFGASVSLHAGRLFVGAPGQEEDAGSLFNSGAVYEFELDAALWRQVAMVKANLSDQRSHTDFGTAIAVSDGVLLVGAPSEDEVGFSADHGAAYVFRHDGYDWVQEQRLLVPDLPALANASFGSSVALTPNRAIIGAPMVGANYDTDFNGAVYAFTYDPMLTQWVLEHTFQDQPLRDGADLGSALAFSDDTLLVGAPLDRTLGSARFYTRSEGWSLRAALYRPTADGGPGKLLGISVATSGGFTVTGQPGDVMWESDLIGSVYVYENDGAALRTKLVAPAWAVMPGEDYFDVRRNYGSAVAAEVTDGHGIIAVTSTAGVFVYRVSPTEIVLEALLEVGLGSTYLPFLPTLAVAISGETIAVGHHDEVSGDKTVGAVHIFAKEGTAWRRQVLLRGTEDYGGFGTSVTVDGNTAVIGAPANAPSQALSSSVYVYTRSGVTWTLRKKLTSPVAALDSFGQNVALKGPTLAVTAPNNPYGCRILIYDGAGSTWPLKQTLTGDLTGIHLGTSLGFDGETLVAGLNGPGFFNGGAVTYARRDGLWKLQDSYRPEGFFSFHAFGYATAVAGPDIAIGTRYGEGAAGDNAGSLTLIHTVGTLELYDGPSLAGRRVGDDGSAELEFGTRPGELVQGMQAVRYLTIYNGTASRVSDVAITANGPDSAGIVISQLQANALDPGHSTMFRLGVMPPDSSLDATLHISATGQPTLDIALTGTVLASAPAFELTEQPNPDNLLQEGGSLLLKVAVSAPPGAVQYRWLKDGKDVPGATGPELLVPQVKLADAGTYQVVVLSLPGYQPGNPATLTSYPARVVVVGQAPTGNRWLLRGSKFALRLPIAGPGYEVQWFGSFGPLANGAPISGVDTPLLAISRLREEDFQGYTPVVSLGSASPLWQGSLTLIEIQRGRPLFSVSDLGTWRVGQAGSADLNPDFPPAPGITFTATGLPPGLKLHSTTGILSGTPSREGLFVVRMTLSNRFGSTTQSFNLQVYPFTTDNIAGAHLGVLDRDPTLNDELGGGVKIDVTLNGVCTGRITFGKIVTRFVCQLDDSYTGKVTLRSDDKRWEYDLRIKIGELGIIQGTITHDYAHFAPTQFTARRAERIEHLSGYYTGIVRPVVPQATDDTYPQGVAYAAVRVSDEGTVVYAGRLSDGTAVTATTVSDYYGQVPLHFLLYNGLGSFQGPMQILRTTEFFENDYNILTGVLSWLKKPNLSPKEVSYAAGLPLHDLQMLGFRYFAPIDGSIVLALDPHENNALLTFDQGGLRNAEMDPDTQFTLTTENKVVLPLAPNNPTGLTLKLDATAGLFTGAFTLKDPDPLNPLKTITSKANYAGVLVPRLDAGFGSFQLPQLISGSKDKARTLSGNLVLEKARLE